MGKKLKLVELDLTKGEGHEHPDIVENTVVYLVKVDGEYFTGTFSRQWYGLNFDGWYGVGLQFDAPGYNSSRWQRVWRLKGAKAR